MTESLQATDAASQAVQKTPNRVALSDIESAIESLEYLSPDSLPTMTLAVMKFRNGFVVVGESAPADPDNFDPELGQKFARENAIRQAWPLFGFALREKLAEAPALA